MSLLSIELRSFSQSTYFCLRSYCLNYLNGCAKNSRKSKEKAGIAQMGEPATANALPGMVKQVVVLNHEASPGMAVRKFKEKAGIAQMVEQLTCNQ